MEISGATTTWEEVTGYHHMGISHTYQSKQGIIPGDLPNTNKK